MSDTQAVLAANAAFYRAFEKRDFAAMETVWSRGTGCLCIHPGRKALQGWETIGNSWQQIFKNTNYLEAEIDLVDVQINGDFAFVVVQENLLQVAGGRRVQAQSIATNLFERMAGQWYLVHHHGSPLLR